jgi:hypothetical protein
LPSAGTKRSSGLWAKSCVKLHRLNPILRSESLNDSRRHQLIAQLGKLDVLGRLDPPQRFTLAQFVADVSDVLECTPKRKWLAEERKSPQQLRMLNRKKAKLIKAFEDLRAYWNGLGAPEGAETESGEPITARGNALLVEFLDRSWSVGGSIHEIKAAIDSLQFPTDAGRPSLEQPAIEKAWIALALNDLFVGDCGCSKRDSEIRIAKIGNKFWNWGVAVRGKGEGDNWRGSEAVRKLLKRHSTGKP